MLSRNLKLFLGASPFLHKVPVFGVSTCSNLEIPVEVSVQQVCVLGPPTHYKARSYLKEGLILIKNKPRNSTTIFLLVVAT
jgi:hypothetical protein